MEVTSFLLIIGGQPQGKGRVRHHGMVHWQDKATKLAEAEVVRKWEEAGEPRLPDDVPVKIDLTLYVARPGGHFKRNGELSAEGERNPRPLRSKPDVDNAIKLVMDALNKKAYRDDVRIVEAHVERRWAEWPSTKIKLSAI